MPWKKSFDLDEATAKAIEVFWAKGYEATSVSDLVDAMDLNKGSLYNAFGSKKDLFVRAFLQYDRENRQKTLSDLASMDDPVTAIRALFDGLIAESKADKQRKGCLLINTALDLPNQDKDVQVMVTSAMDDMQLFFKRQIEIGRERGEISNVVDPSTAAKSMVALVVGLRVLARGAFDNAGLGAIRDQAMQVIKRS